MRRSYSWHRSVVASAQTVGGARLALSCELEAAVANAVAPRELGQVAAAPSAQEIADSSSLRVPRIRKRSCR